MATVPPEQATASARSSEPDPAPRSLPPITYPPDLPVAALREQIAAAVARHQVVIVAGETGSGKTTQLPKICLELGRGLRQRIGHTQPRRLAARNVAQRIAEELGVPLGTTVGYQVRFEDAVGEQTAVKLMTDGILLSELQHDRQLRQYDTLIIDEAHERSLNIDFILGYLHRLLPQRPDLRLIITSATIDVERFARHFSSAPVIEVPGRSHPVETVYLDPAEEQATEPEQIIQRELCRIRDGHYGPRGDVLVFLPGEREIRDLAHALRGEQGLEVLPLYARLSQREQARVFDLRQRRGVRAVLSTNVAETSLTVPGIRYVIDPGEARISRYSVRSRIQRLPIEPVSRASADQRKGRCGRLGPGVCIRLYSEQDYQLRPEFTDPEIRRTNLASVILQMLSLRLGAVDDFPFIDPPEPKAVREGYRLLQELGAVEGGGRLTPLGRQLARLPVDPALGRMILAAAESGHLAPVLVIASALAVQDPRERPAEQKQQSDQAHARFRHPRSDFMAWLALWRYYEVQRQSLSQNQLRKLCQREFLSFLRMREWRDVHRQLLIACRQLGFRVQAEALASGEAVLPGEESVGHTHEADYEGIHRALLCGLLGNIGQRDQGREYLGARNRRLVLFPGSSVQRKPPPWLVAADIVETSRVFARTVAAIEPEWLLDCNPALLRRQYYEPRWQRSSGRVIATERVTLFGLTISDRTTVHYGPIDRETARTLLIREGLVGGRWRSRPPFLRHNLALYQELVALEEKLRRRDLLADEEQMFAFYDQRLPADITTAARLQRWLKRDKGAERRLHMQRGDLLLRAPDSAEEAQFPNHLHWGGVDYPLSYTFDPGGEQDGVTVTVPVALLNRVPRYRFEWLVPGLLREKCIALLKTLPKSLRKQLVPAPDRVDAVLPRLQAADVPLAQALARALCEAHAVRLAEADFSPETLDAFYRMHVQVVDETGAVLAGSRDLAALLERFRSEEAAAQSAVPQHSPRRQGVLRWDFGELPKRWCFTQAGMEIESWPALADTEDAVAIELFDYAEDAVLSHRRGLARLAQLQLAKPLRALRKQLLQSNESQLMLAAAGLVREPLLDDLLRAVTLEACGLFDGECRDAGAFDRAIAEGNRRLVAVANEYEHLLLNTLRPLPGMRRALDRLSEGMAWAREDIPAQLGRLLCEGFLAETPLERLRHYPRYTKALAYRAERVPAQPAKDERATAQVHSAEAPLQSALAERPGLLLLCAPAATYRQMLEEFRVSLFAQQLGTAMPVSGKRLQQQWQQVADWLRAHPR